jgi:hypothetical protein
MGIVDDLLTSPGLYVGKDTVDRSDLVGAPPIRQHGALRSPGHCLGGSHDVSNARLGISTLNVSSSDSTRSIYRPFSQITG